MIRFKFHRLFSVVLLLMILTIVGCTDQIRLYPHTDILEEYEVEIIFVESLMPMSEAKESLDFLSIENQFSDVSDRVYLYVVQCSDYNKIQTIWIPLNMEYDIFIMDSPIPLISEVQSEFADWLETDGQLMTVELRSEYTVLLYPSGFRDYDTTGEAFLHRFEHPIFPLVGLMEVEGENTGLYVGKLSDAGYSVFYHDSSTSTFVELFQF